MTPAPADALAGPRLRRRQAIGGILVVLSLAALLGWSAGALVPERPKPAEGGDAAPLRAATTGSRLVVETERGWRTTRTPPDLPGLTAADWIVAKPWQDAPMSMSVGLVPLDDPSLIPGTLVDSVGDRPGEPATIAGRAARVHRAIPIGGSGRAMDLFLAPTTSGVITAACVRMAAIPTQGAVCREGIREVTVSGVPLPLEDAVFLHQAPSAIESLRSERAAARRALAARSTPRGQAAAAAAAARAYADAVKQLSPAALPGGPSERTLAALGAVEAAYERLAAAATAKQRRRYTAAAASVGTAERRLQEDLKSLEVRLREAANARSRDDGT